MSSEYISIAIHAVVKCKSSLTDNAAIGKVHGDGVMTSSTTQESTKKAELQNERFHDELYMKLTVNANFASASEHNASSKEDKLDRKERATKRKIRTGMMTRLHSNPSIKQLLMDEEDNSDRMIKEKKKTNKHKNADKVKEECIPLLCEAIIQQNQTNGGKHGELEERVNVHEDSLEGIRNAIFSHAEDNLDVLQLLLEMPYFP